MINQKQNRATKGTHVYTTHNINQMAYSLAYVKVSSIIDQLQLISSHMAQINGNSMPHFVIPKIRQPTEEEVVSNKKGRKKIQRKPTKKGAKGKQNQSRTEENTTQLKSSTENSEINQDIIIKFKKFVKELILSNLKSYELLARESKGIDIQLTNKDQLILLDLNLDLEVSD